MFLDIFCMTFYLCIEHNKRRFTYSECRKFSQKSVWENMFPVDSFRFTLGGNKGTVFVGSIS